MSWFLSGDMVLANVETRVVYGGGVTYWTNNRDKSMMIVRNPETGDEERVVVEAPREWWHIQHQMQLIQEHLHGSPMIEVTYRVVDENGHCATCGGARGAFDEDENWLDCPECRGI